MRTGHDGAFNLFFPVRVSMLTQLLPAPPLFGLQDQAAALSVTDRGASISADCDKGNSPQPAGRHASASRAAAHGSPAKRAAAAAASDLAAAVAAGQQEPRAQAIDCNPGLDAAAIGGQLQRRAPAILVTGIGSSSSAGDVGSSGASPNQQQPRGWAAMLPSPTPEHESNVFAAPDAADRAVLQAAHLNNSSGAAGSLHPLAQQRLPPCSLPLLSPPDYQTAAAAERQGSRAIEGSGPGNGSSGSKSIRPSPLQVPVLGSQPGMRASSSNIGAEQPASSSSSRLSQSQITASPAANRPPCGPHSNRPSGLVIPQSPISSSSTAGYLVQAGLLSPNAMARPYTGPQLTIDDLDLDVVDDTPCANDGIPISSSSSPVIGSGGSNSSAMRSGGLRTSRDQDLRRAALMNTMSPKPSIGPSGPSLFTGESRQRGLNSASSSSCGSTPVGSSGPAAATAAADGEAAGQVSPAEHLAQLLSSTQRSSRGASPASTASPGGGSILDFRPGSRSQPATPAGNARYSMAAQFGGGGSSGTPSGAAASSSRSSSMTASPVVPPPSQGPAAALLAGSVVGSPRTPHSPLSLALTPRSGGQAHFPGMHSPLPPPLFVGGSFDPASGGSPRADALSSRGAAAGLAGLARAGLMSPGSSRLSTASPSLSLGPAAAPAGPQQQHQQQQFGAADEQGQQAEEAAVLLHVDPTVSPCISSMLQSTVPAARQQQQQRPEHFSQVLRHNVLLHDTRLGPHGESPLSPAHHSAVVQLQQRIEGGMRLSPGRPTPQVCENTQK